MVVIKRGQRGRDFHKFQLQSLESRHDPCLYFHTWNFFKNGLTFKYLQKLHSLLKHLKQALPCPRENACKLYFGKTTRGQYQKEFFFVNLYLKRMMMGVPTANSQVKLFFVKLSWIPQIAWIVQGSPSRGANC